MYAATLRSFTHQTRSFSATRCLLVAVLAIGTGAGMVGCATRTAPAPVTDMTDAAETPAAVDKTYVVQAGDTLYKIAQANGIDVSQLVRLNNITDPSQLRVGQVLRLDGSSPAPAPSPAPGTAVASPVTPIKPVEPVGTSTTARASDASVISWGWPASGKIIQGFNSSTKGIDIEGSPGDPVQAAADGKVMYAGNGVRGLGNLILLGHSDGFITAYAHNQELLVKTGQEIKKGAKIATVGQSDTSSPRLHFEIRRRGTPVDPLSYLPAR